MKDLKERAIRGGFAKICAQGTNFAIRVGSLMVLARLLDPKDFGLVGMVTAVTGVLNLLKDFGLSTATVQRLEITEEQTSTLFWINILVGAILALLLAAMAPVVVGFYHQPHLFWVTIVLATGFFFNAAGVQHSALLQREMRFTALATIDTISQVVSTTVGIGMAVAGFGYWSLVGAAISLPLTSTICLWLTARWIPGRPRRQIGIRSMMRFGGTVTLNSVVQYATFNIDKILLGRFWGAQALGIYGRSYQLINIPIDNLNSAVGGVAFSALSRLQDGQARLKSYFLKYYALVLAVTMPITIACALFADDLILVLLGPKWKDTVTVFRLLAPTILIFALIDPLQWLLFSLGMVRRSLLVWSTLAPLVIGGYLLGLHYGPKGVAFGLSAVMILWVIPHIAWSVHGTVISLRDVLLAASRPLLSGIVAAILAFTVQFFCSHWSPFPRLILGGVALLSVYVAMLLFVMGQKAVYLSLMRSMWKRSPIDENAPA